MFSLIQYQSTVSASIKELRSEAVPFMCNLVRHFTCVGIVQQAGPCPIKPQNRQVTCSLLPFLFFPSLSFVFVSLLFLSIPFVSFSLPLNPFLYFPFLFFKPTQMENQLINHFMSNHVLHIKTSASLLGLIKEWMYM